MGRVDDAAILSELLQRLCLHFKREHVAAECTAKADVFLAELPAVLASLPAPDLVPLTELDELKKVNDRLLEDLTKARAELKEEHKRFRELEEAKSAEEISAIAPRGDISDQIAELIKKSHGAVSQVHPAVRRALPTYLRDQEIPWPEGGTYEHRDAQEAVEEGFLEDREDGYLHLNPQWPATKAAVDALEELQWRLRQLDSDEEEWFIRTYGVPPDLGQSAAFAELL